MTELKAVGVHGFDPLKLTHYSTQLSARLDVEMFLQRDDLMPVPFGGNKWIKLGGIVGYGERGKVYITNGGIDSNHCRALAAWGAINGHDCHLVLHGEVDRENDGSLQVLDRLGATFEVVSPERISAAIERYRSRMSNSGRGVVVVPGGGHSAEGILAFSRHASVVLRSNQPDVVVCASGTGGTQAGILHAVNDAGLSSVKVIGISVAREQRRGRQVIVDALSELDVENVDVDFRDDYRGEGYGKPLESAPAAMRLASSAGILLDSTYTGKAFTAMLDLIESGQIASGARVLFWHTGGEFLASRRDRVSPDPLL